MPAISPACSKMASAAALPAQASVRGVRPASQSASRAPRLIDGVPLRAGSASILANSVFHRARRRRAQRFVEKDGLGQFLAHQRVAARQLRIARQRLVDAPTYVDSDDCYHVRKVYFTASGKHVRRVLVCD
jgi:hypothetical protein